MKEHLKLLFIAAIMMIIVGVGNTFAQTYSGQAYAVSSTIDAIGQPLFTTTVLILATCQMTVETFP